MNRRVHLLLLGLVLAALAVGLMVLYRLRMGQGDFFPAYSTLRADPMGLRGLHDSLAGLPGVRVSRWLQPLEQLPAAPARTLIMAGVTPAQWEHFTAEEFNALDAAVRGGCRLVIALTPAARGPEPEESPAKPARPAKKAATPGPHLRVPEDRDGDNSPKRGQVWVDLAKLWGVELKQRSHRGFVHRAPDLPADLPMDLPWTSEFYFQPRPGVEWKTLYRGPDPMLLEWKEGLGSIVLAGDSYFLSNEALQRDRQVSLLVRVAGQQPRVQFIESHLGLIEHPGVASLARRYGLAPAFCLFLVLAGLFVWRRSAHFVPPVTDTVGAVLEYNQTAGLEALLRRSVSPAELVATCAAEWRPTARPSDVKRVEPLLAQRLARTPAEAYNILVRALRRGEKLSPP